MRAAKEKSASIPRFFLYGEAPHAAGDRFVHAETIARRSRESDWTIRIHRHGDLHHLLLILDGDGAMEADGARLLFSAPALLVVPAGAAHGFGFAPDTDGWVVTIGERAWRTLVAPLPAGGLFAGEHAAVHGLDPAHSTRLAGWAAALALETGGRGAGAEAAAAATLTLLAVELMRAAEAPEGSAAPGPRAALVGRYRALIDSQYDKGLSVADYAARLGVTPARLRAACRTVAGDAPIALLQARLIAEAKRYLAYTDRTVAEVAYALGFDDPAYFSRLFTRHAGQPPGAFRRDRKMDRAG